MDSYDDAARILKGMLNIGGHSDAGNYVLFSFVLEELYDS